MTEKTGPTFPNDDLLIFAGALTLRRDAGNGLLTGPTLSNLADTYGSTARPR